MNCHMINKLQRFDFTANQGKITLMTGDLEKICEKKYLKNYEANSLYLKLPMQLLQANENRLKLK